MRVHLVNPSSVSFGTAVITPRWLYVLAGATPKGFGDPIITDETLEQIDPQQVQPGDVVGIGIHTANALRGYEIGRLAKGRGAHVIFGGIHATLYPQEARELGAADAVVLGDGDVVWPQALHDCSRGSCQPTYAGGRIEADQFVAERWDLVPRSRYMWGVGANGARLSQALFLLLGVAHGRAAAPPTLLRCSHRRDRPTAPSWLSVYRLS